MCGIFGVVCASDPTLDRDLARSLALSLLRFSETRGREAAGIAVHDGEHIEVLKQGGSVSRLPREPEAARACSMPGSTPTTVGVRRATAARSRSPGTRGSRPTAAQSELRQQPAGDHARRGRAPQRHHRQRSRARGALSAARASGRARQRDARRPAAREARRDEGSRRGHARDVRRDRGLGVDRDAVRRPRRDAARDQHRLAVPARRAKAVGSSRSRRSASSCSACSRTGASAAVSATCRVEQIRAGHALAVRLRDLRRHAFSLAPDARGRSVAPRRFAPNGHAVDDRRSRRRAPIG